MTLLDTPVAFLANLLVGVTGRSAGSRAMTNSNRSQLVSRGAMARASDAFFLGRSPYCPTDGSVPASTAAPPSGTTEQVGEARRTEGVERT